MKDLFVSLVSMSGFSALLHISMFGAFLELVRELIEYFRDAT